ncbi:sulfotransferase 1A1-like isoform X2 [Ostrea edulis]|uniref:sulfotransferase 1A1-like isoform X2 n=1 Tax=Ostrea edulis TaxID=37623 RepID=UPI0024AF2472|nr:sulfotransferase 1A1-like isoform X2 [Ostrea edulis]
MADKLVKYPIASVEEEEIIERKCPSGRILKVIGMNDRYRDLQFTTSGFIPDPRSHVPSLRTMDIYEDDVLVSAFPKCGTHWVWEMVKMLQKGKAEYDKRPKEVAMLEFHSMDLLLEESRPRLYNTHNYPSEVPTGFLEGKGKVIFLLRNPKDVAVSFYSHMRLLKMNKDPMSWDDFVYLVITYGGVSADWFEHTVKWENEMRKNRRTYLCLYYEEMKKNPLETVKTIADYLETPCTDLLAKDITTKCTLEKMRSANKDKHDDRNDSGPNPEMSNPDQMYRKEMSAAVVEEVRFVSRNLHS